ncbi:ABC transporter ATP-binding protein [Vibrio navarrensis]|uniref:ABC transporter ATP-binding protein n=1 Tax=Vibrio navarrensis TaxID=29495 RepID=A0AAI9CT64_9VIBR|nr:ABC transporter ATP-binding protein [Vibrio navarrensis]EGR2794805.1 ABC transporter ATP-binding protein [Vibrio navarrensis]EJL6394289.1 ABC transporter ATP-binding protein [Vibrio navarrensis]EJL6397381.1 ABC transporter ATP-binding protein [Vibrio navarrensis]EJL6564718.1 ABC transporter ATP-binding protein [Vibrio navarrensis]EKA5634250.1 ABC transporter ATP-binding protein [Vibrio navarrensis]
MSCALSIRNLTCQYDQQTILESLSLHVEPGQIVCLLGASGCGKTTLLKAIAGLLPLSAGEMCLNGVTIDNGQHWLPPELRNIGMIFQDYALFPHLTVADNVGFGLKGLSQQEKQHRVAEMLDLVHLSAFAQRYPHQLSGGQQQRVAIARSLAYKPDLLLLDEPFSNIDTQVRHELIGEIRKLFKAQGVTAIFVTHSREEAFAFADKMAVMNHGVIEQYGTASELYYQPSSKFVADFLGGGSYLPATRLSESEFETQLGVVEAQAQQPIELNARCELLLRPQHIQISAAEKSSIHILEQQFMGDHCRYVIESNGSQLLASSSQALSVGQSVSVKVDTQGILAF